MEKPGFDFSLERDTGWLLGSDVIAMISGLIGQAILFWILSGEEYGMFVIALDTCFTILVLLDSGLSARVTRDVGALGSSGGILVNRVVRIQILLGAVLGIFSLAMLRYFWAIRWPIGAFVIVIGIICHIISMTHRGALRSIGLAKYEALSRVIERFGMTSAYAVLAFFGVSESENYVCAAGLFFLIGGFFAMYKWSKNKPIANEINDPSWSLKELFVPALPFAVGFFLLTMNYRFPKLLLGNSVGFEEVGIFNVAMIGFSAALAMPNAIWQSAQPAFGNVNKFSKNGERSKIFSRMRRVARFGLIFGLPAGLIAGYIGFPILFTESISSGSVSLFEVFSILMIGWSSILLTSPDWGSVMGSEWPLGYSISVSLFLMIQFIGFFYFGTGYGLEESAICFSLGAISSSLIYLICTAKSDGLHEFAFGVIDFTMGLMYTMLVIWGIGGEYLLSIGSCVLLTIFWNILADKMKEWGITENIDVVGH